MFDLVNQDWESSFDGGEDAESEVHFGLEKVQRRMKELVVQAEENADLVRRMPSFKDDMVALLSKLEHLTAQSKKFLT